MRTIWTRVGLAAAALAALTATAGAVGWLRRRFVAVTVDGGSMLPTLRPGDRVLVRRAPLDMIRAGQVVVVAAPGSPASRPTARAGAVVPRWGWLIKRAVAVPGDPVPPEMAAVVGVAPGTAVPPGRLLVLGDNRDASLDSRVLGYVRGEDVLGVAVRRLGMPQRDLGLDRPAAPAGSRV